MLKTAEVKAIQEKVSITLTYLLRVLQLLIKTG